MIVETSNGNGGNAFLAFLLGAVIVVVGIVAFFMWDNFKAHQGAAMSAPTHVTLNVKKS